MEKTITLNGQEITVDQLNETKSKLTPSERLVETAPGCYEVITRIQG